MKKESSQLKVFENMNFVPRKKDRTRSDFGITSILSGVLFVDSRKLKVEQQIQAQARA